MALFSSSQPSLRARILPKFPARVLAGNGMRIDKGGGTYVFSVDGLALGTLQNVPAHTLVGRDSGDGPPQALTTGVGFEFPGTGALQLSLNQRARSFTAQFATLSAGLFQDFVVPLTCQITRMTLLGNTAGNLVLDVMKVSFANHPPTAANSVCGGVKPTLSSAFKLQGTTAVDGAFAVWSSNLAAGDIVRFNVDSVSGGIARLSVSMEVTTL